jgi:hypothetical protein
MVLSTDMLWHYQQITIKGNWQQQDDEKQSKNTTQNVLDTTMCKQTQKT